MTIPGSHHGLPADPLALTIEAVRELSRHDDPSRVLRLSQQYARRIIRFDRGLWASRRDLPAPQIHIARTDPPLGPADGRPIIAGGVLAELLHAGQPRLIDDLSVAANDPARPYLAGMRSLAAIPQFSAGEAVDMEFYLHNKPHAFQHDQFANLVLMSSLFGQAAANLARSRELQEAERSIKEQYDIIATLSNTVMNSAMDLKDYSKVLEQRVRERTAELADAQLDTIYMLAVASEAKDLDTGQHVRRIRALTTSLASELGFGEDEAGAVGRAAMLHDVGKIHVPDQILKKPGRLSADEIVTMQSHTVVGERILGDKPFFATARRIARSHHENFDGSGYPDAIRGDQIPIEARIVHLADVYEALVSPRVYKGAWTQRHAAEFIIEASGQMFDPELVRIFTHLAPSWAHPLPADVAAEPARS